MKLVFTVNAWHDYARWLDDDPVLLARINLLIEECLRHPFSGTGKPEPLKRTLAGWWSRRITREHRLVYCVALSDKDQTLRVMQCRHHH